jgi:hypothetical protein
MLSQLQRLPKEPPGAQTGGDALPEPKLGRADRVAIIGTGLVGATTAYSLVLSGCRFGVDLDEQE